MNLLTIVEFLACFIGLLLIIFIAKKIYYRFVLKKKLYLIPRPTTKGIATIGVTLALSIAVVILLILVTADLASVIFRLWSGTRIIVEAILIKIGGLLYGPIIGMCLGAAVDFLCVALTAGVFHIGYFITAIFFGLIGGLIRKLLTTKKMKYFWFSIYSTIISICLAIATIFLVYFTNTTQTKFDVSMLGIEIELTLNQIILIFIVSIILPIIILWSCYCIYKWQLKNKKIKSNWFGVFAPIFMTIAISEVFCNILFIPVFDAMLSPLNYQTWFLIRLLLFIPMVIVNLVILLPVYKIIRPIIKYNYEDDIVDDVYVEQNNKQLLISKMFKKKEVINERNKE